MNTETGMTETTTAGGESIRVEERIRWSDMDTAGIMYFGNYTRLFEIGETELFRAMGTPYRDDVMNGLGFYFLRVNYHCDFKNPLFVDDLVCIETWIHDIGKRSARLDFRVCRGETVTAQGYCTIVAVDKHSRKSISLPPEIRAQMMRFLVPT